MSWRRKALDAPPPVRVSEPHDLPEQKQRALKRLDWRLREVLLVPVDRLS